VYSLLIVVIGIFNIIWLIVGAVMFWGYLYLQNFCEYGVSLYMHCRLVFGFLITLSNIYFANNKRRK
jgi:hypothetical protein